MVSEIKGKYGLTSPDVLSVMLQIPRHKFVPKGKKDLAYKDGPVPIGYSQTMSQPYTVAYMTHLLLGKREQGIRKKKKEKVLEIGTGSGYQAAVLSKLFKEVYTVEIIPELAIRARNILTRMGNKNVHVKSGSGEWGWKEKAPFDAIIITAGLGEVVPEDLFDQLKKGGVLVAPLGIGSDKVMTRFTKLKKQRKEEIKKEKFGIFRFVPFIEEKN